MLFVLDGSKALRAAVDRVWGKWSVVRLCIPPQLCKTVTTTNPIESAFSISASVTKRVKSLRDGDVRER